MVESVVVTLHRCNIITLRGLNSWQQTILIRNKRLYREFEHGRSTTGSPNATLINVTVHLDYANNSAIVENVRTRVSGYPLSLRLYANNDD